MEDTPKVGLEIHCQLDTQYKLFCCCPTVLSQKKPSKQFLRRLRPTQSELGAVDPAALFEFQKGRTIVYEADHDTSCLVEDDEEPPHPLNMEATDIALVISLLLHATPIDEIHIMRKVVIDGSNTTGFQRTAAIGIGGYIIVKEKIIPIEHISLEEDAARKTDEKGFTVFYRIDRLTIPLVEIATGPVMYTPQEAEEVALALGRLLKATKKVKRGIGTIRQDLNISIPDGALVEIKGVQRLDLVSKAVELEFQRQRSLLSIQKELLKRGVTQDKLQEEFIDLTPLFRDTTSKIIGKGISGGGHVMGVKLPGFFDLLGRELIPDIRLGTEMAWKAAFYGHVRGIFHTDELPGYGITEKEVSALFQRFKLRHGFDAAVLVCDKKDNALDALKAVLERAKEALLGVPEETRAALDDGGSRYMRPRPGSARMYPETDIPPTPISIERIENLKRNLPEMPEETMKRLRTKYNLNEQLSLQLLNTDFLSLFERVASTTQIAPTVIANILTEQLKNLEREGVPVENLDDKRIETFFLLVDSGKTAKESTEKVFEVCAKDLSLSPQQAIKTLGLEMLNTSDLEKKLHVIVNSNKKLIDEVGEEALHKLMGHAMRDLRGSVDPSRVMMILKEILTEELRKKAK